jgi:hypothetical protein
LIEQRKDIKSKFLCIIQTKTGPYNFGQQKTPLIKNQLLFLTLPSLLEVEASLQTKLLIPLRIHKVPLPKPSRGEGGGIQVTTKPNK